MEIRLRWNEKCSYDELAPSQLCVYLYERAESERPHYIGSVGERSPEMTFGRRYVRGSYGHLIEATFCGGFRWFIGQIEDLGISGNHLVGDVEGNLIRQLRPKANNPKSHRRLEITHSGDIPPSVMGSSSGNS